MQKKTIITLIVAIAFMFGTGVIAYYGRPVMQLKNQEVSQVDPSNSTDSENTEDAEVSENEEEESENKEEEENENSAIPAPTTQPTSNSPTTTQESGTYTAAQVATHATTNDCWASVSGNVYDLTSWVSRHPGGSSAIANMCGKDATSSFTRQHGGSSAAKAALALLKIGVLIQ